MAQSSKAQAKSNNRSLPKGWQWVNLGMVGKFDSGGTPSKNEPNFWSNGSIPFVTGADITDLYITSNHARSFLTKVGLESGKTSVCKPGTVLFVTRTGVGRIGIADEIMGASQDLSPYTCGEHILPEFVCRYLQSISDCLIDNCRGSTIKGLTRDFIKSLEIPLPPLDEQQRIASRLNEQLAAVESARKAAEEQLQAARQLPSAYLQELFGNSAKHEWNWQKLGEVCELLPAKTIKSIGDTVVTAITTACLSENGFLPDGLKSARMDANDAKQALVKDGEILIARSNTPDLVGRVSMYPGNPTNVVASDLTIRIWASPVCHPLFLTAYLSYLYLSGFWKEMAGGASGSMKKITRTQVLDVDIPIPDNETQKKIVEEMQSKMGYYRQLEQSLESQLAEINRLPASLLREAFAGNT